MIRHDITRSQLRQAITRIDANWYKRAQDTLAALPANPTSKQFVSLWGDIKSVYINLQQSKCIYCETLIEGNISNDIEHFRPKARVASWKVPKWLANEGVTTTRYSRPNGDPGYRNLAYCPWNYAASCKSCNSVLKKNYFPIYGERNTKAKNPAKMKAEKPLFVYPVGTIDDDPRELFEFVGMHPKARPAAGTFEHHRALVTIAVFYLNDAEKRKELFRARAQLIAHLYSQLERERAVQSSPERQDAREWIAILLDEKSPHSNCLNCFKRIYDQNAIRARRLVDDAKTFLQTGSLASGP
jgi:5-methylcytosine-specific restriction endonuclease McrA